MSLPTNFSIGFKGGSEVAPHTCRVTEDDIRNNPNTILLDYQSGILTFYLPLVVGGNYTELISNVIIDGNILNEDYKNLKFEIEEIRYPGETDEETVQINSLIEMVYQTIITLPTVETANYEDNINFYSLNERTILLKKTYRFNINDDPLNCPEAMQILDDLVTQFLSLGSIAYISTLVQRFVKNEKFKEVSS